MKLDFHRDGLQFFFITLVVKGRREILSEVVDEGRPLVSRLGEVVRAAILAVNRVWPAAVVSDYVIMPDHLHFLLIVDYRRDRKISPLFIAHRVIDAVEALAERLERTGGEPPSPPRRQIERELLERRVAVAARAINDAIAEIERPRPGKASAGGEGAAAPVRCQLFDRSPYVELSFDARQLKTIRRYMKLNPARRLWKLAHPDAFRTHRGIKGRFDGLGNLTLLGSPFLFHVRLTLRKTVAEHEAAIAEIIDRARRGAIPVSGFISPGEKEALHRLKTEPRARFIKLLPCTLPDRYDPSAEDSRELAAGRMAILSPFPLKCSSDFSPVSSIDMKRKPAAAHQFRKQCLAMNELAAELCGS